MQVAIGVFFLLLGAGCLFALIRLALVLGRLTDILTDTRTQVIPLLTRLESTLDGVNSELARVDEITESVGTIVKTAASTTSAVHSAVATPLKKVAGLTSAISEGIATFVYGNRKEG